MNNQAAMANYAQQLQAAAVQAQRSYSEQQMLQQMMRSAQQASASAAMIQQQQRMLAAYAGLPGNHSILGSQQTAATTPQRSAQAQQPAAAPSSDKQFNGKLTQIKEFPMEQSHQPPYKLQKVNLD